jgi:20S proteasome alpha/beta subunit
MTLIIGIFIRDNHGNKEIIFASDGLEVRYEGNKKVAQREDVEKIRKLTPKICMGYTGKNAGLFKDVFDELKNKTPKNIKRELEPFKIKLREVILKFLETKKHNQIKDRFIVGAVFDNRMILIRVCSDDNYTILEHDKAPTPGIEVYIAGATDEIQEKTKGILKRRMSLEKSNDEIEKIIRDTISEIAEQYSNEINNHVFIRRLSRNFN